MPRLEGSLRIRILQPTVAAKAPRQVGDVVLEDLQDALMLIRSGHAERYIESPRLVCQ